jgi:hypothetical protein
MDHPRLFAVRKLGQPEAPPLETAIAAAGLPAPIPEFTFAPDREWRFDYGWPVWRIALEIEGGTWIGGRHVTGAGYEADCIKYNRAAILGWLVIRATTRMVHRGDAVRTLQQAFAARSLEL